MSWLYSPLLPGAAQQEAGGVAATDADASTAGVGTATGQAASIAASVFSMSGTCDLAAIGAFSGTAPQDAVPATQTLDATGAGGLLHPDLAMPRKKRKPRLIRMGERGESIQDAEAQAESDFRLLWEAVKIRNDAGRLRAAIEKRNAILADLERAAGIRTRSHG